MNKKSIEVAKYLINNYHLFEEMLRLQGRLTPLDLAIQNEYGKKIVNLLEKGAYVNDCSYNLQDPDYCSADVAEMGADTTEDLS